jgi:hypothetical protein
MTHEPPQPSPIVALSRANHNLNLAVAAAVEIADRTGVSPDAVTIATIGRLAILREIAERALIATATPNN